MRIDYSGKATFKIKGRKNSLVFDDGQIKLYKKQEDKPFVVEVPGEYEVGGVSVFGTDSIFVIELDEIRLCYFSQPDTSLTDKQLEEIDGVDLLFLTADKDDGFAKKTAKAINKIQPKVVVFGGQKQLDQFLKELGISEARKEKQLKVVKSDLPEEMEVVNLTKG